MAGPAGTGLGTVTATPLELDDALRGAVPLLEASRFPQTMLASGVVETIIQESSFLSWLPFITLTGEAYVARHERTLPTVDFRKVNQGYKRDHASFDKSTWGVSILGGEVYIDNFIIRTRPGDGDVKARQFAQKAKSAAMTYDYYAINGDGSDDSFRGLKWMAANGWGQEFALSAADAGALFDGLDVMEDMLRVKSPDAIVCTRKFRRLLTHFARNIVSGSSFSNVDLMWDNLGRKVTAWNGIPLMVTGDGPDGKPIQDDTDIFMMATGDEENVFGILGAGGTMDVEDFGETEAAPGHLGRIEFYPGMVNLSPYALVHGTVTYPS